MTTYANPSGTATACVVSEHVMSCVLVSEGYFFTLSLGSCVANTGGLISTIFTFNDVLPYKDVPFGVAMMIKFPKMIIDSWRGIFSVRVGLKFCCFFDVLKSRVCAV